MCALKKIANAFIPVALVSVAAQVHAADQVDCDNPSNWISKAAMTSQMKSENQRTFASANLIRNKQYAGAMLFTTNQDQTEGYILRTDRTVAEPSEKMCVYKKLAGLRFFDATKPSVKPQSLLSASDADAERACDKLAKIDSIRYARNACGPFNRMIKDSDAAGARVMAQGFNVEKQPDGSYQKNGWLTTISANMGEASDNPKNPAKAVASTIRFTELPGGATFRNADLVYARYTPYGAELMQQLADQSVVQEHRPTSP